MSKKYNDLISKIELDEISLLRLNCEKNPEFYSHSRTFNIHLEYDVKEVNQNGIEVVFPIFFKIAPFASDEGESIANVSEKAILFRVEFVLEVKYTLNFDVVENVAEDIENFKEELEIFAEKNVPVNAWPYARELLTNITARMGFPPLVIPMYKKLPKY